jgi:membrane-bound lytic murein transglycosylase B
MIMKLNQIFRGMAFAFGLAALALPLSVKAGDYVANPAVPAVIDAAVEQGVDRQWAIDVIASAERKQSILDAIARPAEKTKPWYEYREIFLTQKRIDQGVDFANKHADTLQRVSDKTGVPTSIIVSIIGVETFYGRIAGSYRVVDALATLAFDYPPRAPFFSRELEHFLVLAWESGKDPLTLKGSYAGAMGYGQFMPSSYRAYAVDYDADGVIDIWGNPEDAIYSVANYFVSHGWEAGQPVVIPAVADEPDEKIFQAGLKPAFTVGELRSLGIRPIQDVADTAAATALALEGEDEPEYWLGLDNFYVITRYNHSAMYALAVWQLSLGIEAGLAGESGDSGESVQ